MPTHLALTIPHHNIRFMFHVSPACFVVSLSVRCHRLLHRPFVFLRRCYIAPVLFFSFNRAAVLLQWWAGFEDSTRASTHSLLGGFIGRL